MSDGLETPPASPASSGFACSLEPDAAAEEDAPAEVASDADGDSGDQALALIDQTDIVRIAFSPQDNATLVYNRLTYECKRLEAPVGEWSLAFDANGVAVLEDSGNPDVELPYEELFDFTLYGDANAPDVADPQGAIRNLRDHVSDYISGQRLFW